MSKKYRLIELLNKLAEIEPNIYKQCSHIVVDVEHDSALRDLEKEYPELGLLCTPACCVTVASLLATITEIFCGERLCFHVDEDTLETLDFGWYENDR